jgi:hypothetical protein
MTAGLFDLPSPLLQWADGYMSGIVPAPASIAIWAVAVGIVCIELYRIASPQKQIGQIKQQVKEAQQQLSVYDGEIDGAWPLIKSMLGLSLKRVGVVIPATLLAAYPAISVLAFVSSAYGHAFPRTGESADVDVAPPFHARWIEASNDLPLSVQIRQPKGELLLQAPLAVPVPVLHKRVWWNALIANPAGYLPDDFPIDEIRINLPTQELHSYGPVWMRGWEAIFLPILFIAALAYKTVRRIE